MEKKISNLATTERLEYMVKHWGDMTNREIAAKLDVPVQMIGAWAHKLRSKGMSLPVKVETKGQYSIFDAIAEKHKGALAL